MPWEICRKGLRILNVLKASGCGKTIEVFLLHLKHCFTCTINTIKCFVPLGIDPKDHRRRKEKSDKVLMLTLGNWSIKIDISLCSGKQQDFLCLPRQQLGTFCMPLLNHHKITLAYCVFIYFLNVLFIMAIMGAALLWVIWLKSPAANYKAILDLSGHSRHWLHYITQQPAELSHYNYSDGFLCCCYSSE